MHSDQPVQIAQLIPVQFVYVTAKPELLMMDVGETTDKGDEPTHYYNEGLLGILNNYGNVSETFTNVTPQEAYFQNEEVVQLLKSDEEEEIDVEAEEASTTVEKRMYQPCESKRAVCTPVSVIRSTADAIAEVNKCSKSTYPAKYGSLVELKPAPTTHTVPTTASPPRVKEEAVNETDMISLELMPSTTPTTPSLRPTTRKRKAKLDVPGPKREASTPPSSIDESLHPYTPGAELRMIEEHNQYRGNEPSESDRQFKCSYCHKVFRRKEERKRHENSHLNIRQHKCSVCDKTFMRADHKSSHEKTHDTEKEFSCKICNKSFRRADEAKRHETRQIHLRNVARLEKKKALARK